MNLAPLAPSSGPRPLPGGPKPLPPARDAGTVESWLDRPVARLAYRTTDGAMREYDAFATSAIVGIPYFDRLASSSLEHAIDAAARISRSAVGSKLAYDGSTKIGSAPAVAVLQARDGAYYATVLGADKGRARYYYEFAGSADHAPAFATSSTSSLRAIVGDSSYFAFDADGRSSVEHAIA